MKGGRFMDSIGCMNDALAYIEEHLEDDIDYVLISRIACCSEYHFKRMFSFLAGISLSEYIRRRRLTLAALDVKDSNLRIIDIAMKYGYSSADAFSRAFHTMHGILPSEARDESEPVGPFPETLQNIWARIYSEWFPLSRYEAIEGPRAPFFFVTGLQFCASA